MEDDIEELRKNEKELKKRGILRIEKHTCCWRVITENCEYSIPRFLTGKYRLLFR